MRVIKLAENLPDPISYLEAVKKYQNWDNIKQWADFDSDKAYPFIERKDNSHPLYCKNCKGLEQTDSNCPIHLEEVRIVEERQATHKGTTPTIKRCPAIIDTLNSGVVLVAYEDMYFEATEVTNHPLKETIFSYTDNFQPNQYHHTTPQFDLFEMGFDVSHNISVKIHFPYRIETDKNHLILLKDLFWLGDMPFKIVEGLQDFNSFGGIFVNTFWKIPKGKKVIIKKGTPIVHLLEVPKSTLQPFEIVERHELPDEYFNNIIEEEKIILSKNGYRKKQKMIEKQL